MGWIWGPLVISSPDCTVISVGTSRPWGSLRDWRLDECGGRGSSHDLGTGSRGGGTYGALGIR